MNLLNIDLREQIDLHYKGRIILNLEFFEKCFDLEFISTLTCYLEKKTFSPDENVIEEGQVGDEIYFII